MTIKNGEKKYLQYIAALLLTLILGMLGYFLNDVQGQVRSKVDKAQYDCDMNRIEKKIDYLIDIQIRDK